MLWLTFNTVQPQGFLSEIRMFTEHMNKQYVGPQTMHISTFAPGDVVAASSSDDQSWYRAQVISYAQGDDSVLLRYLDYGDCHRVRVHMIRPLLYVGGAFHASTFTGVSLF